MQFFNSPLLCIAILSALATATPVVPALQPRATPCTSAQEALANGIAKNIDIQKQEQSSVNAISKALSKGSALSNDEWAPLKSNFIGVINSGITVRENNQKIAPASSPATAGLKKVAGAQAGELKLAQALTGKPDTDNKNVETLKSDFAGGIKQNQQNQKDALGGCIRQGK